MASQSYDELEDGEMDNDGEWEDEVHVKRLSTYRSNRLSHKSLLPQENKTEIEANSNGPKQESPLERELAEQTEEFVEM